jgi:hypothetical protein
MRITTLVAAFLATAVVTALGEEGVVEEVKQGAKKQEKQLKRD